MDEVLVAHFRCPAKFANFESLGEPGGAPGYFQYEEVICYGRTSIGKISDSCRGLYDFAKEVRIANGRCYVPFAPSEIVSSLHRERYVRARSAGNKASSSAILRNLYYFVRPLLPVFVRKHLQRAALKSRQQELFPGWPVDRSADKFLEKMLYLQLQAQEIDKIPFIWFWPEGKTACATMTHDVETRAGLEFCPSLMDINDGFDIKSSFQIIPHGRYVTPPSSLREIRSRGFEINVHDWNHDGHLFSDREIFRTRAGEINRAAKEFGAEGFRAGVLYRNPDWYDAFEFSYDMSVPTVARLDPQPGGCCTIFPYFIGRILELPVTLVQDYALFHFLGDYSIRLWEQQLDLILEGNGLANCIVHPDYVIEERARTVYAQLLKCLSSLRTQRNIWIALPGEVNVWWRQRSQMTLVPKDGGWQIQGEGSERARIAYASLRAGRVVYTIDQPEERNVFVNPHRSAAQ